jgi:hypothetical protein
MSKQTGPYTSDGTTIRALARAIGSLVQTDGDHNTSIPALTLHRGRDQPSPCTASTTSVSAWWRRATSRSCSARSRSTTAGQSMLTTIDLPVVSHVTRASGAEPFLGMMLTLDVRSIVQMASEMDEPRPRREDASRSISFEVLDADLLDALVRLVKLLGQPALVSGLGAADPAGSHSPPADRSARSATPAPRHGRLPRASRSRRPSPGSSRTLFRRYTETNWRIART